MKSVKWLLVFVLTMACSSCANEEKKDRDFFTSGSREADQRAEQRVAKEQQLRGESGAEGESGAKSLYDRLGGDKGLNAIVDDFVTRVIADPRVNWERKGVTRGGGNLIKRRQSVAWDPNPQNIAVLRKHLVQFLALSTGGPAQYDGRDMMEVHRHLHITNTEFDAAVGDLKATLDKLGVAADEQKELLSVVESTRGQVAEKR